MDDVQFNFLLFFVFLGLFFLSIKLQNSVKKEEQEIEDLIREKLKEVNFTRMRKLTSADKLMQLSLDTKREKICFLTYDRVVVLGESSPSTKIMPNLKIFNYADVLEVEIIEDGETITKTSSSSQIGRALIGGVMLGGAGAIIGGLSGTKKNIDKIKSLDLKLIINDTTSPVRTINIWKSKNGESKESIAFKTAYANANEWFSLFKVIINQANDNTDISEKKDDTLIKLSVADELKKLKSLVDDNILSNEEFEEQKKKLLVG